MALNNQSDNPDNHIHEFLSQFPSEIDFGNPRVLQGIQTLLGTQGFSIHRSDGEENTNLIEGHFGNHLFRIWMSTSSPAGSRVSVSFVASAYDNRVHHNDVDIPTKELTAMTFWEYLWEMGRTLNRSLELEALQIRHSTDQSLSSLRSLATGQSKDPVRMYAARDAWYGEVYPEKDFANYLPQSVQQALQDGSIE